MFMQIPKSSCPYYLSVFTHGWFREWQLESPNLQEGIGLTLIFTHKVYFSLLLMLQQNSHINCYNHLINTYLQWNITNRYTFIFHVFVCDRLACNKIMFCRPSSPRCSKCVVNKTGQQKLLIYSLYKNATTFPLRLLQTHLIWIVCLKRKKRWLDYCVCDISSAGVNNWYYSKISYA